MGGKKRAWKMQPTPPSHWILHTLCQSLSMPFLRQYPTTRLTLCCPCLVQTCSNHFRSQRYCKDFILFVNRCKGDIPTANEESDIEPKQVCRDVQDELTLHTSPPAVQLLPRNEPETLNSGPRTMNQIDQVKDWAVQHTWLWPTQCTHL